MDAATRMGVVISDSTTRQHWLADGASVVLHLCRAWLSKPHPGYAPEEASVKLWSPESTGSPSTSLATLTSIDNRELELYISHVKHLTKPSAGGTDLEVVTEKQWFLLQDLAHRYFKWLEQIRDRANKMRHSADFDLIRQGNRVIGFEFRDLLRGDSHVEPCVLELRASAGVWLPYARDTDTVHILGSGFGELIQPEATTGKLRMDCGQRLMAPRDVDYLMAPLSVLREGMERLQHTSTCAQLSHGLYWWNIDEVFQKCQCKRLGPSARCTSLVKKLHGKCLEGASSTRAPNCLPTVFERCPTGAIIIGYEPQLLAKDRPTIDNFGSKSSDQSVRQHSDPSGTPRTQKRSPSDSGYASNVGNSSQDSPSSSLISEEMSPAEFRIRGAASDTGVKKLKKRRKTDG